MVVNLIGSNGVQIDVTSACTFSPANNTVLTASDTAVTITYLYQHDGTTFTTSQALTIRELSSIAVTTPPIKTAYQTGETLDLTGIAVTATYSDGFTANVTNDCTFNPSNGAVLSSSDTSVTVTYVEGSTTTTTSVAIGVKELVSIAVTHLPIKTAYHAGETLDLTGLVVTATYDDSSTIDVTNNCTYSPDDGDTLTTSDTSVSISYTDGSTTKTASQVITVIGLSSIAITNPPTETDYTVGDALDLTGIEVTATYSDNSTADVTASCTFSPANGTTLSTSDTGVTASYTEGGATKTATQAIAVSYPVYGVEWDGTATSAWTRTDSASAFTDPVAQMSDGNGGWIGGSSPFDNIQPWSGMTVVNDTAGKFVQIPKFYYKLTQNGSALKIQICQSQRDGFHVSPAHMNRGDGSGERNYVYVGRYHTGYSSGAKSQTGLTPSTYLTQGTARSNAASIGSKYFCMDFATWFTIWLLYLVEFANWNSQAVIGLGKLPPYNDSTEVTAVGYTDSMTYHTGTTQTKRTNVGFGTQYRNIEGLWENVGDWLEGCGIYRSNRNFYVILNPSQFTSNETQIFSRGINLGNLDSLNSKYPSEVNVYDNANAFPIFLPGGNSGSAYSYICDMWKTSDSSGFLLVANDSLGGTNTATNTKGLFALQTISDGNGPRTYNLGYRLMKLP